MYLVSFKEFNDFIIKKELDKEPPIFEKEPFILEYKRNGIMMAKIEMSSIGEFKHLRNNKLSGNIGTTKNKYWIRGEEWV